MFILPFRELRYIETGEVVTEEEYKAKYPFTSFAIDWEPEDAEWVEFVQQPQADEFKLVTRDGIEQVDGKWYMKWKVEQRVPTQIPMLNAHLALIEADYMETIEDHFNGMTGNAGRQARAFFNMAQTMRRDHPLVEVMRVVLELTPKEIDDLFIHAYYMKVD